MKLGEQGSNLKDAISRNLVRIPVEGIPAATGVVYGAEFFHHADILNTVIFIGAMAATGLIHEEL